MKHFDLYTEKPSDWIHARAEDLFTNVRKADDPYGPTPTFYEQAILEYLDNQPKGDVPFPHL